MLRKGKSDQLSYGQKLLVNDLTKFFCNTGRIEKILPILECKSSISLRLIDWFVTNYSKKYGVSYSLSEYEAKHKNFSNYTLGKKKKESPKKSKTSKEPEANKKNINDNNVNSNNVNSKNETTRDKEEISFLDALDGKAKNKKLFNKMKSPTKTEENKTEEDKTEDKTEEDKTEKDKSEENKSDDDIYANFNDLFFVYNDYRRQLKSYNKKSFDVFRRDGSFDFYYTEKNSIETNEGQLNFFRWALKNYIIDYIYEHLEDIEKDMNDRTGKTTFKSLRKSPKKPNTIATDKFVEKERGSKSRKKRTELSESSLRRVHKINSPTVVSFK